MNYKKSYFYLFNQITDIIEKLKEIQLEAEEKYIEDIDSIKFTMEHSESKKKND